jgi:hypothetical protein
MAEHPTKTFLPYPRFELGRVYTTPGARDAMQRCQLNPMDLIYRHVRGDWGDVCAEDAQANEHALKIGARLFSVYALAPPKDSEIQSSTLIWLITEADRSVTTFLLPEEY